MSKMSDNATVTTNTVAGNNTEQRDLSSSFHMVSNSSIRSSSSTYTSPNGGITDKENDLNSLQKEKLSKESKKNAMGDVCSSNDPMKSVIGLTVSNIINDNNVNNQMKSKGVKMETKSTGTKKTQTKRPSDDFRRHVNGVFYGGHGRRNSVNNGSRSTTYTSRDYWRPHSSSGYNGTNLRRSTPGTLNSRTRQMNNDTSRANDPETTIDNAGNANQRTATTESQKKSNSHAHAFRSQVTRTFHNGALRANRTWHNNVTTRSRSHMVASEFNSQFSSSEYASNSESVPHVNSTVAAPRIGETCPSGNNTSSGQKHGKFPIIYVAPTGTISILLNNGVMIEVAVDRAIRVLCHDKFSAACNSRGTGSCILHKKARIFQQDEKVFCNFGPTLTENEKATVFGTQGVLFTMSHLSEAYLVSSTIVKGTLSVSLGRLQFPSLDYDFTVRMFFTESQTGDQFTELCNKIVQEARYGTRDDGSLTLTINGIYIKQDKRGNVEVNCRPKHISCSPSDGVVHVRTNVVDMAVQEDDKAFVKKGLKRVHVSRSGMVVSDGNCITSMDHFGNIISSA